MRKVWILALASVLALALASSSLAGGLSAQGEVSVEELADGVYLYTYEVHRSLFLVTDGGVLVTDPQSGEAAARYLEEIRKITDAPVRYLVYSHHHGDHVSGGAAFGEEPVVVAHANVPPHVSGNEAIVPPELTFEQRATIWLDDLEVRLIYPGPSETDSNVIVHVPERDVAFMVDAVRVRSVPWRDMADGDALAWVEALRRLEELDFEILAPGHGPTGEKAHVTEYIEYFEDLIAAVRERVDRGESLEEIQASLELPQYSDWTRYDEHFELNIAGVHRALTEE